MVATEPGRDTHDPDTMIRNHYHATLVAVLAATLAIGRRLDPERR